MNNSVKYQNPSSESNYEEMERILSGLNVPKNHIVFIHARIKNLKEKLNIEYKELTYNFLNAFQRLYKPKTILVPTFTYSFTKSGVFNKKFSKSEVGRFSEEFRLFGKYRTPDPVFSVVDFNNYLAQHQDAIDYLQPFEDRGLYGFLEHQNAIILNFDLEKMIMTHLHRVEKNNDVPYRFNKIFEGVVYDNEIAFRYIKYNYYVRNLEINTEWDREKIKSILINNKAMNLIEKSNYNILWGKTKDISKVLNRELEEDKYYLVKK